MAGTRCPRCSAAVRPGAPWCTQCYAPAGAPAASPVDELQPATAPATAPGVGVVRRAVVDEPVGAWPCTACGQSNDLALAACAACGTPFLAAARAVPPTLVLPGVGDLLALTPVRRVGLAVAVVVAFVVMTSLLALLLS